MAPSRTAFLPAVGNRGQFVLSNIGLATCPTRPPTHPTHQNVVHVARTMTQDANSPPSIQAPAASMDIDANIEIPAGIISAAHEAADASGAVLRRYFRSNPDDLSAELKFDGSPVTAADMAAEAALRGVLESKFPAHQVLGEENGGAGVENLSSAEWAWVLDPIDGTKAFMCGRPTFGTLISLLHYGTPVFGIIDQPISRERWAGGKHHPTQLNGKVVSVCSSKKVQKSQVSLASMVVHATTPDMFIGKNVNPWEELKQNVGGVVYGADCYAYALLSSGFVELVVEADLKPWDFLALVPVVEAAGGVFVDWNGAKVGPKSDGRVIAAASKEIMQEVVDILSLES